MTNALELIDLKKIYNNQFEALKGINLTVSQGDFFALLGPNGAGKSTTIGIITSLVKKTSGHVSIFGHDIDQSLQKAQRLTALVPQEFNFNMFEKVIDIVINQAGFYGIDYLDAKKRAEFYLKKLELWDKRNVAANRLSGGMKRRLMIARAMVVEPKLLILDEPTAGVDLEIRRSMWSFLTEINQSLGVTIILTTHYLEEAEQLCKNIAIINHGEVITQTTMQQLLAQLNEETVILEISGQLDHIKLDNYPYKQRDDGHIEVTIKKQLGLTELFKQLEKNNITVKTMRNKSNRLEELFLTLVTKKEGL